MARTTTSANPREQRQPQPAWTSILLIIAVWGIVWALLRFFGVLRLDPQQIPFALSGFLLLAAISGLYLIWEMRRAPGRRFRLALLMAYFLVLPVGAFSGLQGPLVVRNMWLYLLMIPACGLFPMIAGVRFAVWIANSAIGPESGSPPA